MKKSFIYTLMLAALFMIASCGKSGNTVNDLLDAYEEYVNDYISYIEDNPGQESVGKAAELVNKAKDVAEKLENRKSELTEEQLKRLSEISTKLSQKVLDMSGMGSSFDSDFGGDSDNSNMFNSDSDNE